MDAVIESAIEALKQRRDEIDQAINSLVGVNGGQTRKGSYTSAVKKPISAASAQKKKRTMSPAIRAKLRAAYAAAHPGWKPKKK